MAVISGAANGIGRGVALALAQAGAAVCALDVDPAGLRSLVREVDETGGRISTHLVDVSDPDEVQAAFAAARQEFGDPTVLVTAAAIDESVHLADLSLLQWTRMVDVNLHGTFHCLQAAIPGMRRAGHGRIILFGSNIALKGGEAIAHYGAAKGAVHALARCAAIDLAADNITVNTVAPGPVDTDMLAGLPATWLDEKRASMPARRFGTVDEIVPTVLLLASPAGGFYTGATMNVSGGDVLQ